MESIRSKIFKACNEFKVDTVYWDHKTLEPHENSLRNYPAPWIRKTIEILEIMGAKTIVEIGSARTSMRLECISYYDNCYSLKPCLAPGCCQDGHSTYFWARSGLQVHTVDIDANCKPQIENIYIHNVKEPIPRNLHIHSPRDGIEFLENFDGQIDFLFLDGWDIGTGEFAESHLAAFLAAKDKLSKNHIVAIDDTDFNIEDGGKDKYVSPYLIDNGYIKLLSGRQAVFINPE